MFHSALFGCYKALLNGNEAVKFCHMTQFWMNFIINGIVTSKHTALQFFKVQLLLFMELWKSAKNTNFNLSLLQIRAKLYHKLENFLLPIGASVNTNWGKRYYKLGQIHFITNWGKCYDKLVQLFLFQIGASVITNWASLIITKWGRRFSKLGQLLQIRATIIKNCGSYYKLR